MADTQTYKQQSFSTENDQVDGYRRLSRLAVWSVPLGLLSALAMVNIVLWVVPVIAVAIAMGGLYVVSRSNETTGRRLALLGLGLAVLFGTWGIVWTVSRQMVIDRQSRKHAATWLQLMQQRKYMKAHQLTMEVSYRLPVGRSLEKLYAPREQNSIPAPPITFEEGTPTPSLDPLREDVYMFGELNGFKRSGVHKILVESNGDFDFAFSKTVSQVRNGMGGTRLTHIFRLKFPENHEPRELDVTIEMRRAVDGRRADWTFGPISKTKTPS